MFSSLLLNSSRLFHKSAILRKLIPFKLADIGEGITEVQIIQWHVKEGARIKQFDKIAEVQSDKATVEITSRYDGVVKKLYYSVNDMAKVGEPLVDIDTGDSDIKVESSEGVETEQSEGVKAESSEGMKTEPNENMEMKDGAPKNAPNYASIIATDSGLKMLPSVRRLAKEQGIDLRGITGTGRDGRILKEDLIASKDSNQLKQTKEYAHSTLTMSPIILNPVKKAMIKSMQASLSIPHFVYGDEYRMDPLMAARQQFIEATGQKISLLPFIFKAISRALSDFPAINAHYFPDREYYAAVAEHNITMAVDTQQGLSVPVLKSIQGKSVPEIAKMMAELLGRARENKLRKEDFQDATISFSNIGSIGGTYASPVIVPPQVAIGALGRSRPIMVPNSSIASGFEVQQMAAVSWAADHRVIDGASMARFSNRVKELLESPLLLMM